MLLKFRFVFVKVQNYLNDILFSLNEGQMVYFNIMATETIGNRNAFRRLNKFKWNKTL